MRLAEKHLIANTVNGGPLDEVIICECCGKNVGVKKMSMRTPIVEFSQMGIAFTFFFQLLWF